MRTELKNVADTSDRSRAFFRLERSLLESPWLVGEDDLIDLVQRKARDLDWRIDKN